MSHGEPEESRKERVLSQKNLLAATGEFDVESIQFLNLADGGIDDISPLEDCINLLRLDLRRNEISVLRPLRDLKTLNALNLSANRITNIDALGGLECLTDLNLAGNLIGTFDRIQCLKGIDTLEKLRFSDSIQKLSNPICHDLAYEEKIMRMFPGLITLDGMRLKGYGCELYKICKDLDEQIRNMGMGASMAHEEYCPCGSCESDNNSAERTFGPVEERPIPGAWLRPGYFSLPAPPNKEDCATIEFRQTLEQCKKLNNVAKEDIEAVRNK